MLCILGQASSSPCKGSTGIYRVHKGFTIYDIVVEWGGVVGLRPYPCRFHMVFRSRVSVLGLGLVLDKEPPQNDIGSY